MRISSIASRRSRKKDRKKQRWNGIANWARDDYQLCKRCGAEFHRTHLRRIYCSPACVGAQLTAEDRLTIARFVNICAKYQIAKKATFATLVHGDRDVFDKLNHKIFELGEQRKNRWLQLLKKFCNDFDAGWFDLYKQSESILAKNRISRRSDQLKKSCPRRLPSCPGGFIKASCPKQFRECEFT